MDLARTDFVVADLRKNLRNEVWRLIWNSRLSQ